MGIMILDRRIKANPSDLIPLLRRALKDEGWRMADAGKNQEGIISFSIFGKFPEMEMTGLLPELGWVTLTGVQGESQVKIYDIGLNVQDSDIQKYLDEQSRDVTEIFVDIAAFLIRAVEGWEAADEWSALIRQSVFSDKAKSETNAQIGAESSTSYQENLSLVCDKREFRTWFERQYPNHAKYYKDTPKGATFSINLTRFDLAFNNENGKYQYTFTITEPKGHSKIRQEFIGTIRNTFGSTMPQIGAVKDTKQHGKSGRPHLSEDIWAWEQVNTYNRPRTEVYREWLEREDVKARDLQDPERQFDRITKPEWGNK